MDRIEFLTNVKRPGAFQKIQWVTPVTTAAKFRHKAITKRVDAVVRTGIDYANLSVNADRETVELPWGHWIVFPYLIGHTPKGADTEREYGRLYVVENTIRATYYVDGVETPKSEVDQYLTPSARKPSKPNGGTITPRLEHLRFVS